ncbi:MAG: type II toxin-antitoxin system RelE/ParE family toxin [Caulobacterales bacterium]
MRRFTVELDPAALGDLENIRDYVTGARDRAFADSFVAKILHHLEGFATAPWRGVSREDIRPSLRLSGWRRTLSIAFSVNDESGRVIILAVLYRGRDVEREIKRRT